MYYRAGGIWRQEAGPVTARLPNERRMPRLSVAGLYAPLPGLYTGDNSWTFFRDDAD
jgi:hypothetical protein